MDYDEARELAEETIAENGAPCKLMFPGEMSYDPTTNTYTDNSKRHDGNCLITDYEARLIDGTVIQRGDRAILAVLPVEPIPSRSYLEIYNTTGILIESYLIVNVEKVSPNAVDVILYKLQCRK